MKELEIDSNSVTIKRLSHVPKILLGEEESREEGRGKEERRGGKRRGRGEEKKGEGRGRKEKGQRRGGWRLTTCCSVGLRWNSQRKGSPERFPLSVRVIPPSEVGEEEREEEGGGE